MDRAFAATYVVSSISQTAEDLALFHALEDLSTREQAASRNTVGNERCVVRTSVELSQDEGQLLALEITLEQLLNQSRTVTHVLGARRSVVNAAHEIGRAQHVKVEVERNLGELVGVIDLQVVDVERGADESQLFSAPPAQAELCGRVFLEHVSLGDNARQGQQSGSAGAVVVDARASRD